MTIKYVRKPLSMDDELPACRLYEVYHNGKYIGMLWRASNSSSSGNPYKWRFNYKEPKKIGWGRCEGFHAKTMKVVKSGIVEYCEELEAA